MSKARIAYLSDWMYPVHVGFTSDEKKYKSELKRLGVDKLSGDSEFPTYACALHLKQGGGGNIVFILVNRDKLKGMTTEDKYALLTHEITHAKQMIQYSIKEKEFSDEAEAYLVQYLSEWVFKQFKDGK